MIRSGQGPGNCRVKGTDSKQILSVLICSKKGYSGSIWREHRRAG